MKFFKDQQQTISYIINELTATLEDDIENQKKNGEPPEDYKELEDKIKDIESASLLLSSAPGLLGLAGDLHGTLSDFMEDGRIKYEKGERKRLLKLIAEGIALFDKVERVS